LNLLVRSYIHTATPVASVHITKKIKRVLSPASVRNVFKNLSTKGYVKQPHTSSGRIPTEKAYRFFVDSIVGAYGDELEDALLLKQRDLKNLQRHIAMKLHLVSGILGRGAVLGTMGFEQLFTEPEFSEQNMVIQFGRFLDNISKKQSYYTKKLSRKRVTIVIGKENPTLESNNMSVVVSLMENNELFYTAGLMRMDYERIIDFFIRS